MKEIDNTTATATNEFTDGDPAVPTPATTLPAWYMNMTQAELVKVVKMAGLTLDTSEEGDAANNQLAEALAVHVAGLDYYNDTGATDAYVLTVIGAAEQANTEPNYFDGMRVRFIPDNTNTGAATIRVGAQAIKNIKVGAGAGSNPSAGDLTAGIIVELSFDAANDVFKFKDGATATPAFESRLLHIQDQKPANTHGGASIVGIQDRDLNTILTNEISGASLASSIITLPIGEYYTDSSVPGYTTRGHMGFLYNVTDSVYELYGTTEWSSEGSASDPDQTRSFISGRFSVTGSAKTFIIKHGTDAVGAQGLGVATSGADGYVPDHETYSDVKIWKL